jgi:hypothetical protein
MNKHDLELVCDFATRHMEGHSHVVTDVHAAALASVIKFAATMDAPPYTHRNGETLNPTEPGPYWIETTNHFNGVVDFTIDYWMRDGYWALGYHVPQDTDKIYGPIPEPIKVNPHA